MQNALSFLPCFTQFLNTAQAIKNKTLQTRRPLRALTAASLLGLCCAGVSAETGQQDSNQLPCESNPGAAIKSCAGAREHMDWVSWQLLEPSQRDLRAQHCGGDYQDPLRSLNTSVDPATQPIFASANQSEMIGDLVRLNGGAQATQGYRTLRADQAEFHQEERWGNLFGNVELREPGVLLTGATANIDTVSGRAQITANNFVFHDEHIRGSSDLMVRREDEIIELNDASYTYCPPGSDRWMLFADNIELDFDTGTGVARDAKVEFGGVPILYTPYLEFPLDDRRKSGFLWAEIGTDSEGGGDLALPYYFNLAPNYDATLTPRYINNRGLLTELEMRYLGENVGYWEVGGAYIHGDELYEEDFPDQNGNRWLALIQHNGLFQQRWRTSIDFTKTEDDDYFNDFGTTSLESRQANNLVQRGEINYLGDTWSADLRYEEFQTLARDIIVPPYEKKPQLTLYRSALETPFRPNLVALADLTEFENETRVNGQRLYGEAGVTLPMNWIFGSLRTTALYRHINYDLEDERIINGELDDSPDVGAPLFDIEGELIFERPMQFGSKTYLNTLEPKVYYLWSDFEEQDGTPNFDTTDLTFSYDQLYRRTRFSGRDRLDDSNQLAVGVTTRVIDETSGREKFKASIGQIFYFDDREVTLGLQDDEDLEGTSALAGQLDFAPGERFEWRSSWVWNTDQDELEQGSVTAQYMGDNRRIINLGYNFRRDRGVNPFLDDVNQADVSTYFPVGDNWALILRVMYDFKENDRVNDLAGFEYNNCCWRIRIVHERTLNQTNRSNMEQLVDRDHATFVQFQLKGLGGTSEEVSQILEETIRGFTDSDK